MTTGMLLCASFLSVMRTATVRLPVTEILTMVVTLAASTAEMVSCRKMLVRDEHTVGPSCSRWKA